MRADEFVAIMADASQVMAGKASPDRISKAVSREFLRQRGQTRHVGISIVSHASQYAKRRKNF